jgi:hypothetical protein
MKETFISTSGTPGTNDFAAIMFTLESLDAKNAWELKELAKKAACYFAFTEEGQKIYKGNCGSFKWGDLIDADDNPVFHAICDDMGIKITWLGSTISGVDGDAELFDDISKVTVTVAWDADGERDNLPNKVTLDIKSSDLSIANALYEEYGCHVKSYIINKIETF